MLKFVFLALVTIHVFEIAYCGVKCLALKFTALNSARWMISVAANGLFSLSLMPEIPKGSKKE